MGVGTEFVRSRFGLPTDMDKLTIRTYFLALSSYEVCGYEIVLWWTQSDWFLYCKLLFISLGILCKNGTIAFVSAPAWCDPMSISSCPQARGVTNAKSTLKGVCLQSALLAIAEQIIFHIFVYTTSSYLEYLFIWRVRTELFIKKSRNNQYY